jgi:hypothetical protein
MHWETQVGKRAQVKRHRRATRVSRTAWHVVQLGVLRRKDSATTVARALSALCEGGAPAAGATCVQLRGRRVNGGSTTVVSVTGCRL